MLHAGVSLTHTAVALRASFKIVSFYNRFFYGLRFVTIDHVIVKFENSSKNN